MNNGHATKTVVQQVRDLGYSVENMQPMRDRILVKRLTAQKQIGSILIPDIGQEKSLRGTVIAVGPGEWELINGKRIRIPLEVYPGDIVHFGKYTDWDKMVRLGDDYVIIQQADVRCVENRKANHA
jgi:co-chaperonin GroES (HSP10)